MNGTDISILMCVHNGMPYLIDSVESLLNQTVKPKQIVLVNDASNDTTREYLSFLNGKNCIEVIHNETNLGLTRSLNIGLSRCTGRFIARQDADDISYPERLEYQLKFMLENKTTFLLGTGANYISADGKLIGLKNQVYNPHSCKDYLLVNNPIVHSSAFFKRIFKDDNSVLYDIGYDTSQDYELWSRISNLGYTIQNIPFPLVQMRLHSDSVSRVKKHSQSQRHAEILASNWNHRVEDQWPLNCAPTKFNSFIASSLLKERNLQVEAINDYTSFINVVKNIHSWLSNKANSGEIVWKNAKTNYHRIPKFQRLSEKLLFAALVYLHRGL